MHTSATYVHETAAEEISAWLSGKMPSALAISHQAKNRSREVQGFDNEPARCFLNLKPYAVAPSQWSRYFDSSFYRAHLVSCGIIHKSVGKPMLMLDTWAKHFAALEIADFRANGAYVDRGLDLNGDPVRFM